MALSAEKYSSLPADVLQLICEQLGDRRDFGTLYNCALAGRDNSLSKLAIENMYRVHNKLSAVAGDDTDLNSHGSSLEARSQEQQTNIAMWALQWKSIIQSSLRSTFYPYCLYIRSLDLRNLELLLEEGIFMRTVSEDFFRGDMSRFFKTNNNRVKKNTRGSKKLTYETIDSAQVLALVGESITNFLSDVATENHAEVAVEDLNGNISTTSLRRWTSQLPKLKILSLFDGSALDGEVAASINKTCFEFEDVTFYDCRDISKSPAENDQNLAAFFSTLRSNSIKSFNALSARGVGPETLLALNNHSESLKVLKLDGLEPEAIEALPYLQGCRTLEILHINDKQGIINLDGVEEDSIQEVVSWLCGCHNLHELSLKNLANAPVILERVCLHNDVRLQDLEVEGYKLVNNASFHRALSQQTSLQSLKLKADAEDAFRDDIDTLVQSVCCLNSLKNLNLVGTSDYFRTTEVIELAKSLKGLEEFWFSGYEVNDLIWPHISQMSNLKSLNVHAMSKFSANGILNYVATLKSTNRGLVLSVMNQEREHGLDDAEVQKIRRCVVEKVDGQFDYVLYRDFESDDESDSD